jgi:hypothetical protein
MSNNSFDLCEMKSFFDKMIIDAPDINIKDVYKEFEEYATREINVKCSALTKNKKQCSKTKANSLFCYIHNKFGAKFGVVINGLRLFQIFLLKIYKF